MISHRQSDIFDLFKKRNSKPITVKFLFDHPSHTSGIQYNGPVVMGHPWDEKTPQAARNIVRSIENYIKRFDDFEDHGGVWMFNRTSAGEMASTITAFSYANRALNVEMQPNFEGRRYSFAIAVTVEDK